jgi:hypothetical protein
MVVTVTSVRGSSPPAIQAVPTPAPSTEFQNARAGGQVRRQDGQQLPDGGLA